MTDQDPSAVTAAGVDRYSVGTPAPDEPCEEHDGSTLYPTLTPYVVGLLRGLAAELRVCLNDHPEDERLARVEANVRWLVGERV